MIGKGVSRTGFQAGAMGEAVGDLFSIEQLNEYGLVPTGDENRVRDRHLRHRQQAARHPQLRGELPVTGRVPDAGRLPAGRPAELQRHRLRRDRARGPRRRRDLGGDQLRAPQGARRRSTTRSSRSPTRRCRRSAPRGQVPVDPVPGQPALDPARCSTRSCSCRRTRRWSTRATRSSRPTRRASAAPNQARAVGGVRAPRPRPRSRRRPTAPAARPASSPTPTRCRTSRRRARPTRP